MTVDAVAPKVLTKTDSRLAARCAAIASLGAAVIHFAVAPMHWGDWLPSGVFFVVLASFQLLWAFVAWSGQNTVVLAAGVAANVGAIGLWVISCITGPPVGPSAGQPEEVATAGICVLLLQLYVVMGAGWAWSRKQQAEEVSGFGRALVLTGANTIVAAAVTAGLASSLQGNHHDHHGGATEAQGAHNHEAHMDVDAHTDGDAHMEGHHHPSEPQPSPAVGVVKPSPVPAPEDGLPVTDIPLEAVDDHLSEPLVPATDGASPPAPATAAPAAKPAPTQPPSTAVDSDGEADGHQHHHDD